MAAEYVVTYREPRQRVPRVAGDQCSPREVADIVASLMLTRQVAWVSVERERRRRRREDGRGR